MRLIDADALELEFIAYFCGDRTEIPPMAQLAVKMLINNAPTIDPESLRPKGEWIPVKERTPHFSPNKWRKVLVTIEDSAGERFVSTAKYHEEHHFWYEFSRSRFCNEQHYKVIAWMERPQPYLGEA